MSAASDPAMEAIRRFLSQNPETTEQPPTETAEPTPETAELTTSALAEVSARVDAMAEYYTLPSSRTATMAELADERWQLTQHQRYERWLMQQYLLPPGGSASSSSSAARRPTTPGLEQPMTTPETAAYSTASSSSGGKRLRIRGKTTPPTQRQGTGHQTE